MRAIPFTRDFNPSDLDCDPGPAPWVRDARWLSNRVGTPAAADYIAEAKARDLGPVHGFVPSTGRLVALAPVPEPQVLREYVAQSVLLPGGLRLAAGQGRGPCPIEEQVGLVSLSPVVDDSLPQSAPLHEVPPEWLIVGAIAADRRWTDAMVAVAPETAREFARATGQPYYALWRPGPGHGRISVRSCDGTSMVESAARLTRAVRPCPMIPGAPCGQLCHLYGGPWVSRSIRGAARWLAERGVRLADVGCDTCGDGDVTFAPGTHGPQLRRGLVQGALDVRTGRPVEGRTGWVGPSRYGQPVSISDD